MAGVGVDRDTLFGGRCDLRARTEPCLLATDVGVNEHDPLPVFILSAFVGFYELSYTLRNGIMLLNRTS